LINIQEGGLHYIWFSKNRYWYFKLFYRFICEKLFFSVQTAELGVALSSAEDFANKDR